jgi:ABC-type Fe3+/spermidine/putrescine transport system ATPase subunit
MSAHAAVILDRLVKRFGEVVAVNDVSLSIERGQFVTLLGPSGCGKTTLLRIVAGLETASSGNVWLDGRRVTDTPAQARGLGFAFQRYALFPHLSVLDNVAFGLRVRGVRRQERRGRAMQMLELVRLAHLANRLPAEISGGQAQRVALARALAPEPSVLLLDEPLAALDLAVRTAMQEELRRLHRELGTTFVYVTHDQSEALTMSDRIVLLCDGRLIQDASPFELYRQPRTLFAATFVGESNAWPAQAAAPPTAGEPCRVRIAGLPERHGRAVTAVDAGAQVVYVLRPERIGAQEHGAVQATVHDVLARGAQAVVVAEVPGGPTVRVMLPAAEAEQHAAGAPLRLDWEDEDALVFPADAERGEPEGPEAVARESGRPSPQGVARAG